MDAMGPIAAIGGLLLVAVLLFAMAMNRRRSRADRQRTEEATRDLYTKIDRQDKVTDPDPHAF